MYVYRTKERIYKIVAALMFKHSWNINVSATLLLSQGELIDLIERNVESAGIYVHRGQVNLKSAVVYKSKGRKVSVDTITRLYFLSNQLLSLFSLPPFLPSSPAEVDYLLCRVIGYCRSSYFGCHNCWDSGLFCESHEPNIVGSPVCGGRPTFITVWTHL